MTRRSRFAVAVVMLAWLVPTHHAAADEPKHKLRIPTAAPDGTRWANTFIAFGRDIAKQTLVSAGAVSQRVVRAERDGLVRRSRSGLDGRGVIVGLTDAGHALVESTVADLLRHEDDLLTGLTPAQRHQLADLLRLLLADLTDRFGVDDRP